MSTAAAPPGPKGRIFSGNLDELRRDALGLYTRSARDYGDVSSLHFGLRRVYLINHPALIEQVLVAQARHFIKHYALRMNRLLFGDGLLTSDGDFWLRQRRLLQPLFHRDRLAGYGAVMVELAERLRGLVARRRDARPARRHDPADDGDHRPGAVRGRTAGYGSGH